ncbi:hypothetical protein VTK56DRAFT_8261 [Thermocarpiscus australiensis]
MMAPVTFETEPRYLPLALAVSHVGAAIWLSYTVGRSLYRSHKALGPAQDTRRRTAQRSKLTTAFGSLAALGLVLAITSWLSYLTLSYRVWASERGIQIPDSLIENLASSINGTESTGLYLRHWLSDTPVFLDALEIVAEKPRRLWWGQQRDLATISWTTLLAIEGRRRRIPHLWAYALLPHLVSLSYAQNLFYVALLQTPSPIPSRDTWVHRLLNRLFPQKPHNWLPKLPLLLALLVLNYGAVLWLPYAAGTSRFPVTAAVTKLLTLAPLILPAVVPASWGTVHPEPHDAYPAITKLFNVISVASALLHAKATASALFYSLPGSYKHRHSIKIPFDTERRSNWERSATAVEKVLGSLADHPVVAAVGKDVLLCALSLGLWAAIRALDVDDMLQSVLQTHQPRPHFPSEDASSEAEKSEPSTHEESPKRVPPLSMTLRRRGRPPKTSAASITSSKRASDEVQPTPRRRGRPRKTKPEPEHELDGLEAEDSFDDKTYEPTPAVKAAADLGDVAPEDDFDWEPAALAWGLTALGGLGVGSAAVFGAECISR